MIVGTGVDLVEIARLRQALERHGERFLHRIYTSAEIDYCKRKQRQATESLAARFAAKEAGAKALGTGMARGIGWRELEVAQLPGGRPTLLFHGRAAQHARSMGITAVHLSLSHSRECAVATVTLEGKGAQ